LSSLVAGWECDPPVAGDDAAKVLGERRRTVDSEVLGKRSERRRGSELAGLTSMVSALGIEGPRARVSNLRTFPVGSHPLRAHPVEPSNSEPSMMGPPPNIRRTSAAGTSFYSFVEEMDEGKGR
jgi:hypothetical protein